MRIVQIRPQGLGGMLADVALYPFMKGWMIATTGDVWEAPQRTHRWNNIKIKGGLKLNDTMIVRVEGDPIASRRYVMGLPVFHLGGWNDYVALSVREEYCQEWYPGWVGGDVAGVSRIPSAGSVRLLVGLGQVTFFGVDRLGCQVPLQIIGRGRLGDRGPYRRVPLR